MIHVFIIPGYVNITFYTIIFLGASNPKKYDFSIHVKNRSVFQQDNILCHTSRASMSWFDQSPDLNAIEIL